jgi:ParB family transcriptional regulator, chromosome partitioning protein
MAKRRRLEAPDAAELAQIEAGFAAKPVSPLTAPIAQVAAEIARLAEPPGLAKTVSNSADRADAEAFRQAQAAGRVLLDLPLESIDPIHLMRDRMVVDADDLAELKASIRTHGQRLPVEVVALEEPGRYGLISGWRRLKVLTELAAEEGPAFGTITALLRPAPETADLYTAMIEENELRAQITPYERGRIAVMAAVLGIFPDTETALNTLFAAASKAKRSKIRSFAFLHEELGDMLHFGPDLSERNGLRLAHALREGYGDQIRLQLIRSGSGGPAHEWALIEPLVAAAEAQERHIDRGGRPKVRFDKPRGRSEGLANGISMERVLHEDGYSIRLRGAVVDVELIEVLMSDIRNNLSRRFNWNDV